MPLGLAHGIGVKQLNRVRGLAVEHLLNQTRICWILLDQKNHFTRSLAHTVSLWTAALGPHPEILDAIHGTCADAASSSLANAYATV
jgi:hypothetical protein